MEDSERENVAFVACNLADLVSLRVIVVHNTTDRARFMAKLMAACLLSVQFQTPHRQDGDFFFQTEAYNQL